MSLGSVTVNQVDLFQGSFKNVERTFLFMGETDGDTNAGNLLSVNARSDLDTLLGAGDSILKTQVEAAINNCNDPDFFCYVLPFIADTDDWVAFLDAALEQPNDIDIEGVILCEPVTLSAEVTAANAAAVSALTKYAKFITIHLCVSGIDDDEETGETWAEYATRVKAVINGLAELRTTVTPLLHGNNLGIVIGRLCNPAVTIADSPMRVATGPLVGLGTAPVDTDGEPLTMAILKDLADARFSVPQWYQGYNGVFWGDMMMLANEASDYQVYEHLRVADKAARRVRVLLIARIADRKLNSTPKSIAQNKTYLLRPLREMSRAITIGGQEFPGEIQPPQDEDIEIIFTSISEVSVAVTAAPYQCPKKITAYIALDLTRGLEA